MNKTCFIIAVLFTSITITGCKESYQLSYIYDCENGLCVEYMNLDSTRINDFSEDNIIYKDKLEFVFDYKYTDSTGVYLIGNEGHLLDTITKINSQTILNASFHVDKDKRNSFQGEDSYYPQSWLMYDYYDQNGETIWPKTSSGLIENELNIWIHPFRRDTYFAMLNINPYPYVQYPISVGQEYEWQLSVGGSKYTNPIWAVWDGNTLRKHSYRVIGTKKVNLSFDEDILVYLIEANSISEIGESSAEFEFSEKYGFVKMKFNNINNSVFEFNLSRINTLK